MIFQQRGPRGRDLLAAGFQLVHRGGDTLLRLELKSGNLESVLAPGTLAGANGLGFDNDINSEDPDSVARGEATLNDALAMVRDLSGKYLGGVIFSALGPYDHQPTAKSRANSQAVIGRLADGTRVQFPGNSVIEARSFKEHIDEQQGKIGVLIGLPTLAMLSWLWLDRRRTRRPKNRMGSSTSGTPTAIIRESFRLVMNIITRAPTRVRLLRRAMLKEEPMMVCSRVVSVVRRDMISPERLSSKYPGCRRTMLSNTAFRRSALTRSPSQETR